LDEERERIEQIAKAIGDSAIKVHKSLGPGLLESAYQYCRVYELRKRGLNVQTELILPIVYDGHLIEAGYRIDEFVIANLAFF
jgi:GxxExxY protein